MNIKQRHIVILCSRLDQPAGTERAIVNTANLLFSKGDRATIVVLDETEKIFFPINSSISVYHYPLNFGITEKGNMISRKIDFFKHRKFLKEKLEDLSPTIVLTTEYHFTITAGLIKKRSYKLFSWEHHHFHHLKKNHFWNILFKKVYPKIDTIICLNPEESRLFEQIGCRTFVIPNFIGSSGNRKPILKQKQILTAGWLTRTKGSDLIPAIAEKVFAKHPDWVWRVIGQGEEQKTLKNKFDSLLLVDPVLHIENEYQNSSIYVLPSRFECFPMVLLEAMSFGVPCIAFDCPTGPRHIIQNNIDGILVAKENVEAMADAIIELIEDEEKRKRFGENAIQNIQRFSPETVYELWENLFHANRTAEDTSA
jgi:glycosyltransferase involved in cell wall biosynthesis